VFAGFVISNSETGCGAFTLTPRLIVQVCRNGMTIIKDAIRAVHLGSGLLPSSGRHRAGHRSRVVADRRREPWRRTARWMVPPTVRVQLLHPVAAPVAPPPPRQLHRPAEHDSGRQRQICAARTAGGLRAATRAVRGGYE
jgi:hypothetical protein